MNPEKAQALTEAFNRKVAAENHIKEIVCSIVEDYPAMPRKRFHILAQALRKRIAAGQDNDPHQEFFRLAACNDGKPSNNHPVNLKESCQFLKTFEALRTELSQALEHAETGKSDDGQSDLVDALPLAAQEVVDKILANPEKFLKIEKDYRNTHADIFNAEFFNSMFLEDALCGLMPSWADNYASPEKEPKEENAQIHIGPSEKKSGKTVVQITQFPTVLYTAHVDNADFLQALTNPGKRVPAKIQKFQP